MRDTLGDEVRRKGAAASAAVSRIEIKKKSSIFILNLVFSFCGDDSDYHRLRIALNSEEIACLMATETQAKRFYWTSSLFEFLSLFLFSYAK